MIRLEANTVSRADINIGCIVSFLCVSLAKNHRQAYAVSEMAGMQHSAESWGTGRAVARIPRVSGGGTSRAGQGAFGNQCRAGRMFAPTKVWRRWHRKINVNQKRYAVVSAVAASALPGIVFGRGHVIDTVPEIPLVVDSAIESVAKTKAAIATLKSLGAWGDVKRVEDSRKLRAGKGKMRGRRHTQRRGPLIVFANDGGLVNAFRNISGVEVAHVDRLNLLQLAPGGHLGRFVIWSRDAFNRLSDVWGSVTQVAKYKTNYTLPRNIMTQSDIARIINSDEIQSRVRAPVYPTVRRVQKKNPLKNFGALVKLNPYALTLRRTELLTQERRRLAKEALIKNRRADDKSPVVVPFSDVQAAAKATSKKLRKQKHTNFHKLIDDKTFALTHTDKAAALKAAAAKAGASKKAGADDEEEEEAGDDAEEEDEDQ